MTTTEGRVRFASHDALASDKPGPRVVAVAAAAVLAVAMMSTTSHATRSFLSQAPPLYLEYVTLQQGEDVVFETTELTGSADTVLHLLREDAPGDFTQVAFNDDVAWPNLSSRIAYTNASATTSFLLVLRPFSTAASGTCHVVKNGVYHHHDAPVGGFFTSASLFTFAGGDDMRTVHHPGGSVAPAVFSFQSSSLLAGVALGNAPGGAARLPLTGTESHFLFGTPQVRDGAAYVPLRAGWSRLMVNDVGLDADGDGVGDALEATLGTCPTVAGCGDNAAHGMDTDRDGLADGEEIWGVSGTLGGGVDDLPFARWGASPLHKDLFVEVDWMTTLGGALQPGESPFQWILEHPTQPIGEWTGPLLDWVAAARGPYAAAPAEHVHNPDGQPGVDLHLDLGVAPLDPQSESQFGAWSTAAARAVVPDFIVVVSEPIDGEVGVTINNAKRTFDATGLSPTYIAFGIGYNAIATGEPVAVKAFTVDTDGVATIVIEAENAGVHFERLLSVETGFEGAVELPHEDAGSLRDQYQGDPRQVDAIRIGRVRYGVVITLWDDGSAHGARFVTGLPHSSFNHELGHTVGLQHYGHYDWGNADVDCIPHYFSLMNYAPTTEFTDWDSGAVINPAAIVEKPTLGEGFDHLVFRADPYNYEAPSDATGTDWTRDGVLSPAPTAWRSTALSQLDHDCKAFSVGRTVLQPEASVVGPPDLVRHEGRLYALWSVGSSIRYQFAALGPAGAKGCTGTPDPFAGDCVTWSDMYTLASGGRYLGVTAYSDGPRLYVASHSTSGIITVRECSASGSGVLSAVSNVDLPGTLPPQRTDFTPELVPRHQDLQGARPLGLLLLGQDGHFQSFGRQGSSGNTWVFEGALLDVAGHAIAGAESPAAVGWPDVSVTGWLASEGRTLAVLPDHDRRVEVYALNPATNRWVDLDLHAALGYATTAGKPFIVHKPVRTTAGLPAADLAGHFMIGWMDWSAQDGARARFRLSSLVSRADPPTVGNTPTLGVLPAGDFLQNLWATTQPGSSAALYSDAMLDNVFGVVPLDLAEWLGLNFYPHADGAPDHDYAVYSDFRVMEDYVCTTLAAHRPPFPCGGIDVFQ